MKAIIIIKGNEDHKVIRNIKAHIEMQVNRKWFDKITYHFVDDSLGTEVISVRTDKQNFEDLKNKLEIYYPKQCAFITRKKRARK